MLSASLNKTVPSFLYFSVAVDDSDCPGVYRHLHPTVQLGHASCPNGGHCHSNRHELHVSKGSSGGGGGRGEEDLEV